MAWIFQGNPDKFAIEDYLARYPELVYWRTPRYADQISIGDRAYIWRSGNDAGAIAVGTVVEAPAKVSEVKHPEALGDDLWWAEKPDPEEPKTGIRLEETRLLPGEGGVSREDAKASALLAVSVIIRMPTGTVFPLTEEQNRELERMWGLSLSSSKVGAGASEGERRIRAHYRRERSVWLKREKLKATVAEFGALSCELCHTKGSPPYPLKLGKKLFEVHHRKPLATATEPVRTTLEDLAVLCANCHRAVHATDEIESNFKALEANFSA